MPTPSQEIIQLLSIFAASMTAPTFANALVLLYGAILAPGRRTVSSCLRTVGLGMERNFSRYHHLFSRARWSCLALSRTLLVLLVEMFVPEGAPVVIIADETLERRQGRKIKYKSIYRDAVRSTQKRVVLSMGIRWLCLSVVATVPWSRRPWALPFLLMPTLSEKACERLGKKYRGNVGWMRVLLPRIKRWLPGREMIVTGDGAYAAVELVRDSQKTPEPITLVARMRMDSRIFDQPGEQPKSKRGPKPKMGKRQDNFSKKLEDNTLGWQKVVVEWYGGVKKTVEILTDAAMWQTPGADPVMLRYVLVRCKEDEKFEPAVFLCTAIRVDALQVLRWAVLRWNIEVLFEEMRACLGFETQRHWSNRAVERVTPCLFGLFSIVVCMAKQLHPVSLPLRRSAWYKKEEATFSDVLAAVRAHLWQSIAPRPSSFYPCFYPSIQQALGENALHEVALPVDTDGRAGSLAPPQYLRSCNQPDLCLIPRPLFQAMYETVCYTL
jgi:hypothetical protein